MLIGELDDGPVEILRFGTSAEAEEYALVLVAMGIECRLIRHEHGIGLGVAALEVDRARHELLAYEEENRPQPAPMTYPFGDGLDGVLIFCAVGVFVYSASGRGLFSKDWWTSGSAQAGLIVNGEWWRALTALGLHADEGHLIANLILGGLFGIFLAHTLGAGLAWLAILVAGGAGNLLNALTHPATHTSVGASTAVFAALGLLAALTWKREAGGRRGFGRWLPLAGGVMLLAFLGVGGERTDVGAHIAGFLSGGVLGAALHFAGPRLPHGRLAQIGFGAVALGLFALAWGFAFANE
ncbi:MAG: rhomboid family intramembrane serine protease [Alphaproteobacteria bacterium]